MKPVFQLQRVGTGRDSYKSLFCVEAIGIPELREESGGLTLLNGLSSTDPAEARATVERLVGALNEVMTRYWHGDFHRIPVAAFPLYKVLYNDQHPDSPPLALLNLRSEVETITDYELEKISILPLNGIFELGMYRTVRRVR